MQMRSIVLAGGLVAGTFALPVQACTLSINNGGTMGLSSNAILLGSEEPGGAPAALLIGSVGAATIQVNAPSLIESPIGYDDTSDVVAIKYFGTGGLSGVAQDYTDATTSFSFGVLPLTILTMDARVVNPNAFDAGTYRLRTVVTCF